jgi:hypothetical protein
LLVKTAADVTKDVGQIHCLHTGLKIGDEFYEQSEYSVFIVRSTQTLRVEIVVEFFLQFKLSIVVEKNVFNDLIKLLHIFP